MKVKIDTQSPTPTNERPSIWLTINTDAGSKSMAFRMTVKESEQFIAALTDAIVVATDENKFVREFIFNS